MAVENDYDSFAEACTVENDTSLINAYYARPATVDLAGDVAGRRILDAGCGAGAVSVALRDRGAIVAGFDRSAKMVELARQRLGADTDLPVSDIAGPLPYPGGAFDDVIAALVLHYLEDWTAPLAEYPEASYFTTCKWSDEYTFNGQKAVLTYWHRPLNAMTDAFTAAGFRTPVISEPPP